MKTVSPNYFTILRTLRKHEAEFIIIGGVCGVLHGAPLTTFDLDIVHQRTPENIQRLLDALDELETVFRHHPARIKPKSSHLEGSGHSLLSTNAGPLDILGTISAFELDYDGLLEHSQELSFEGKPLRVLTLEMLIETKEKLGRPKDLLAANLLRHTLAERAKDDQAT